MTVAEAIRAATQRLATTSDTARLDAETLMAHALGTGRSDLLLRRMNETAPGGFSSLVNRRAAHEPVAYITGVQEFYGRPFRVTPDVLIPRGDTETLIDIALEMGQPFQRVLDLGTGAGALLLTSLAETPSALGWGVDASGAALEVARENAEALEVADRARFERRNWRSEGWRDDLGCFDLILCNPPYVEDHALLNPDVRQFEPASALFSGIDGLDDYRCLFPQLATLLAPGGLALFEIGASQGEAVSELALAAGFDAEIRRDLANRPRCVIVR